MGGWLIGAVCARHRTGCFILLLMAALLDACATMATPDEYQSLRVQHFPSEDVTILRVTGEPRYSGLMFCGAQMRRAGRIGRVYVTLDNTCTGPRAEPRIDFVLSVPDRDIDILYFGDSQRVLWQR